MLQFLYIYKLLYVKMPFQHQPKMVIASNSISV